MIDTIVLQFRYELSEDDLVNWDKYRGTYTKTFTYENKSFFAKYIPINYKDFKPMLRIYLSPPNILFGCSHQSVNVSELITAIPIFDHLIHKHPIFSNLESISYAQLVRFDACHNFQVGTLIPDYLDVIKKAEFGKKKKNIYDTSVQFISSEETISIYDKKEICKHPEAFGLLRIEDQIKKANLVQEILGKEFPTIHDLSDELLIGLIQKVLDTLYLSEVNICCMTESERRIQDALPNRKVLRKNLINYLRDTQHRTPEYIKGNTSLPTIRKYKKILNEIGISPYLVDKHIELPPLEINQKVKMFH